MDYNELISHVDGERNRLKAYDKLAEALRECVTLIGARDDLKRQYEEAAKALTETHEATQDSKDSLKKAQDAIKAARDRLATLGRESEAAQVELAKVVGERDREIADHAKLVQDGVDAATSELKARAREEISRVREEITQLLKQRDEVQSDIDRLVGRLTGPKE